MIFHNIAVQHAPATPRCQVPQEAAKKALAWSSGVAVDVGTVNPVHGMVVVFYVPAWVEATSNIRKP